MRYSTILVLGFLAAAAGCDLFNNALEVQNPSNIPASGLETPGNAQLLVNGAVADFECAAGAYVVMGGLITDELRAATQPADRFPYDRRTMASSDRRYAVNTCIGLGVYTPLQTARFSALNVLSLLQSWTDAQVPGRESLIATAQAYEGYSLVLLGEGFCTMVVSTLDANRERVYGGEISRDSVLKLAVAAFGDAITTAQAAGPADIVNMALVGRARAHIDLGQPALAAADAQQVAPGYVKYATASDINSRRYNRVWQENSATSTLTSLGVPYINMTDPRVPLSFRGDSSVTKVPLYQQLKYPQSSSPIRLASRMTWSASRSRRSFLLLRPSGPSARPTRARSTSRGVLCTGLLPGQEERHASLNSGPIRPGRGEGQLPGAFWVIAAGGPTTSRLAR